MGVEKMHHVIESLDHIRLVQDDALQNGNNGGFTIHSGLIKDNTALAKSIARIWAK